jgi:hypothetical protein
MKIFLIYFSVFICLLSHIFLIEPDIPIQQIPQFPGGEDSLWCFLENNLQYDIINSDSEAVKYVFMFRIDTLGQASNFKFAGSIPKGLITRHDSLKKVEIIRVLKLLPRWTWVKDLPKYPIWWSIPITTPLKDFKCKRLKLKLLDPN